MLNNCTHFKVHASIPNPKWQYMQRLKSLAEQTEIQTPLPEITDHTLIRSLLTLSHDVAYKTHMLLKVNMIVFHK